MGNFFNILAIGGAIVGTFMTILRFIGFCWYNFTDDGKFDQLNDLRMYGKTAVFPIGKWVILASISIAWLVR